ncbi:MAG: class I SAM-dependent methyltransferase [Anaerolineales bacterium]|nr:class I SAM-dependent methyltransferase [Anaerolineales bacterium]
MTYRCPICHQPVDSAAWTCASGHRFQVEAAGGLVRLVTPEFAAQLARFLPALEDYRARLGRRLLDPAAYPLLPGGPAVARDREWRQRQYDLEVVRRRLARAAPLTVLEIGAYNGWLTHHLAAWGHAVTAVEPFTDPYDGLGAARFYPERWLPLQLDLRDLSVLPGGYQLVILNRCLASFPNPAEALRHAQAQVAPGGQLLTLGLQVFGDPARKVRRVAELEADFQERYGFSAYLWPTRAYLDRADQAALRSAGLRLRAYAPLWLADLKARLTPSLPRHYWGWWGPNAR